MNTKTPSKAEMEGFESAAALRASKRLNDSYGAGCARGHRLADAWLANPRRGDDRAGGTLQHVLIELAEALAKARTAPQRAAAEGAIVGFSYRLECPQHAEACQAWANARRATAKGGAA